MTNAFSGVVLAVLKKDVRSHYPLLLLVAVLHGIDSLQTTFDPWPVLTFFLPTMLILANCAVIFAVIQADPPVSLTDDWLVRPLPRSALLVAKGVLLALALYVPRVATLLVADLLHGYAFGESLLEALLINNWVPLAYLPIVIMTAACTATVLQGLGVIIGLFVLIFVIPTPILSLPGPHDLAVGEALTANGLMWIGMIPAKLIIVLMTALCLWGAYARRNLLLARAMFATGLLLAVLTFVAPMLLLEWGHTFALQRAAAGGAQTADSQPARVTLRQQAACFPAQRVADIAADADFTSARQRLGVRLWTDQELQAAGENSVAFVTRVGARGLPRDWRIQVAYVTARYANDDATLAILRPAMFTANSRSGVEGDSITHSWLLTEADVRTLGHAAAPRLELDYSVAVLRPVTALLAADGSRRHLPGIGYCGATREEVNNRIRVDCLSVNGQPAMISAELNDVPASRVDGLPAEHAPRWLRLLNVRRVVNYVQSPGLVDSAAVKVSGYVTEAFTTLRVSSRGVLGDTLSTCPLPGPQHGRAPEVSSWNDRSPHERRTVAVADDVQLEVLDWGGSGRPLVLLHGLGATAHSFDELAPVLARSNRVVGITRRGIGGSSRPDHGYSQERLTQDILQVLDALDIRTAVFVGHSIAGDELSTLGVRHPERVAGLIYLDAAYDRASLQISERQRELNGSLPDRPPPLPADLLSYAALRPYLARTSSDPLPEGELIAMYNMGNRYLAGQITLDPRILQAIEAGIHSPDYANLRVPTLALYATSGGTRSPMKPWYDANDVELRKSVDELQALRDAMQRREIEKFRKGVRGARVLELPGATHWIFVSQPDAVLEAIGDFVGALPTP